MRKTLEAQLADFLRRERGDMTFARFAKRLGIRPSSLYRLEMQQQSITLRTLQQIMERLKCSLRDIFPDDFGDSDDSASKAETRRRPALKASGAKN